MIWQIHFIVLERSKCCMDPTIHSLGGAGHTAKLSASQDTRHDSMAPQGSLLVPGWLNCK